jgi:hypothetical protein
MKDRHLEFIQGVINRMASNSFLIKGWTITLISALFALAAKDSSQDFIIIAYFPAIMLWLLDGYYLYQERLFRKLYDIVRVQKIIDYSLNTRAVDKGAQDWISAILSITIAPFYGIIILTLIIIMFYFK